MIIGFTGTRSGMSSKQKEEVAKLLDSHDMINTTVLHGGCIGADIDFHELCEGMTREVYPGHSANAPNDLKYRGEYKDADVIHSSQTHFKRNRDIVDRCDILIATPYNDDSSKGGTWYTIKYAQILNKQVIIINRK